MLERFEATFLKAIATEMAAMERRLGSFTVPLSRPVRIESSEFGVPQRYQFVLGAPNDKLVLNTECDLVFKGGERLVNIDAIERNTVTVSCDSPVPLGLDEYSLVIYPWFLYEKLKQAISSIGTAQDVCPETAFRLFGKTTPLSIPSQLVRSHDQLNESQRRALASERFDTIIVEEAGMAVLPSLFYCACLARDKAVMIGDPRQLPPIVTADDAFVRSAMGRSIFEVTVPDPHAFDAVVMLDTQYRMHPSISRMVSSLFYEGKLICGPDTAHQESMAQRDPYPGESVIVIDTAGRSTCRRRDGGSSRYNESTARLCVDLARQGVAQGVETTAIITPYVEQARLVRKLLSEAHIPESRVEAHTVHRFQGNERDVVIFDTVDAQPLAPGVLLTADGPGSQARNLVNVSISRARGKLIIIADVAYFRQRVPGCIVSEMLELAAREGTVIPARLPA